MKVRLLHILHVNDLTRYIVHRKIMMYSDDLKLNRLIKWTNKLFILNIKINNTKLNEITPMKYLHFTIDKV